jgi:hypothetical protein
VDDDDDGDGGGSGGGCDGVWDPVDGSWGPNGSPTEVERPAAVTRDGKAVQEALGGAHEAEAATETEAGAAPPRKPRSFRDLEESRADDGVGDGRADDVEAAYSSSRGVEDGLRREEVRATAGPRA